MDLGQNSTINFFCLLIMFSRRRICETVDFDEVIKEKTLIIFLLRYLLNKFDINRILKLSRFENLEQNTNNFDIFFKLETLFFDNINFIGTYAISTFSVKFCGVYFLI